MSVFRSFLFAAATLMIASPVRGQMPLPQSPSSVAPSLQQGQAGSPPPPVGINRGGPTVDRSGQAASRSNLPTRSGPLASAAAGQLPQTAGQRYRNYDLRPYTGYLTAMDHPEQAVVDWVLRETGTDVWFGQPFGFLSADRDTLSVYHTDEMHQVVSEVVERFSAGEKDPQVLHLRMMTVGSPNWRSRSHMLMQHVNVESPGVQAWLLSKENAAVVLSQLRARNDSREVQDLNLSMFNGQTERLASTRGRNYVRNVRPATSGWPPYEPETGEVQEGYRLAISPLLSIDGRTLDCVIKAEIDQVDKLNHVNLELPLPTGQSHRTRIDVPQVVSWRLHERFRWPADMVLLLSCGVVASPEREGGAGSMFDLQRLAGSTPGRADALMFIEHRGRATENLTTIPAPQSAPAIGPVPRIGSASMGSNRGRY